MAAAASGEADHCNQRPHVSQSSSASHKNLLRDLCGLRLLNLDVEDQLMAETCTPAIHDLVGLINAVRLFLAAGFLVARPLFKL